MQCGAKKPAPKPAEDSWTCAKCGHVNTGKFCMECGEKKPEAKADGWICPQCGKVNKGKFCAECGTRSPQAKSSTSATSAAGSRKIPLIRRSSARSAAMFSTIPMSSNPVKA